jgi:hypothetical protein
MLRETIPKNAAEVEGDAVSDSFSLLGTREKGREREREKMRMRVEGKRAEGGEP